MDNFDLHSYWGVRNELSLEGGCPLRDIQVVLPNKLREKVFEELHIIHPGFQRMKLLAKSHVWWPYIDQDIQEMVKGCCASQEVKQTLPVALLHPKVCS